MRHCSSHCRTESSAFSWSARRLHAPAAASVSRDRACASFARSSHALGDRYPAPCTADFGVAPRCFASSVNVAKTSLTWTETSPAARCSSFACRQRAMLSSTSDTRSRPPGLSMSPTCRHVASGRHFRSISSICRSLRLALGNGLHGKSRSIRLGIAVTVTANAFFQSSISPDSIAGGVSIPHRCNASSARVMACARSPSDSIRTDSSSKRRLTRSPSDFKSRLACSASRADHHLSNSTCHSGGVSRSPAAYFRMRSSPACHVARSSGGGMAHQLLDGSRIRDACLAECGVMCLLRVRDVLVESSALFVVDALLLLEVRLPIDPRPSCVERFLDCLPGPCQASRSESMPAPLVFEASGLLLDCVNEPSLLGVRHHRRSCLLRDFLRHSRIAHLPQRFAAFDQRPELRLTRGGRVRGRLTAPLPNACRDVPQQTDGIVLLLAPRPDRDRNG